MRLDSRREFFASARKDEKEKGDGRDGRKS